VFGPDEWLKYFPGEVTITKDDLKKRIHSGYQEHVLKDLLKEPYFGLPQFLFLGVEWALNKLTTLPHSLPMWYEYYAGKQHPKFDENNCVSIGPNEWHLYGGLGFQWYLMPIGVQVLSPLISSSYDIQVAMLPDGCYVPSAFERVTANILYYLLNKKYLDTTFAATTQTLWAKQYQISVHGDPEKGIQVFPTIPLFDTQSQASGVTLTFNVTDTAVLPLGIAACVKQDDVFDLHHR
jgi:hypothetical protein